MLGIAGMKSSGSNGTVSWCDPIIVSADNVADTVIADGFYDAADICTGDYADDCEAAGIS